MGEACAKALLSAFPTVIRTIFAGSTQTGKRTLGYSCDLLHAIVLVMSRRDSARFVFALVTFGWLCDSHGVAHSTNAHSVLLGASGKVVAIGADREACMVDFGPHGIHKMLVGRKARSPLPLS